MLISELMIKKFIRPPAWKQAECCPLAFAEANALVVAECLFYFL
jgi:hypothetical protein